MLISTIIARSQRESGRLLGRRRMQLRHALIAPVRDARLGLAQLEELGELGVLLLLLLVGCRLAGGTIIITIIGASLLALTRAALDLGVVLTQPLVRRGAVRVLAPRLGDRRITDLHTNTRSPLSIVRHMESSGSLERAIDRCI